MQWARTVGSASTLLVALVVLFHVTYRVEDSWGSCVDCGRKQLVRRSIFLFVTLHRFSHHAHGDEHVHKLGTEQLDRRFWGGWLCACPCRNGTVSISSK